MGHRGTSTVGSSGAAETGVSAAAGPVTAAWKTGVSPSDGLRCKYRGTPSASFSIGRCDSGISSSGGVFGADGHSSDGLCQSGWKAGSGCGGAGCVQDSGGTKGCSFSKGSAFAAGWGGMGEFMTAG